MARERLNNYVYWIAKRQWDKCVAIGAPAVEPLIAALRDKYWDVRKAVAEALVRMYHSGRLGETHKRLILAQRDTITAPHFDAEMDLFEHTDTGIGVSFPL